MPQEYACNHDICDLNLLSYFGLDMAYGIMDPGPGLNIMTVIPGMVIPMLKIRLL